MTIRKQRAGGADGMHTVTQRRWITGDRNRWLSSQAQPNRNLRLITYLSRRMQH
jgi:hypothetical protein